MPNSLIYNDPNLYLSGLRIYWNTPTTLFIDYGACRDSTNINDIKIDSALVVDSNVTGANGLDIGTIANSSRYNVFAIGSSTRRADPAVVLSLPGIKPYLAFDYDMYRLIGAVYTDGSAEFLNFRQNGEGKNRTMMYDAPLQVVTDGQSDTWDTIVVSAAVPSQATLVYIQGAITPSAAGRKVYLRANDSSAADGSARISGDVSSVESWGEAVVPCDNEAVIQYKVDNASDSVDLYVKGYLHAL